MRIGVIGLGNIGRQHAELIQSGRIPGMELAAVCSRRGTDEFGVPSYFSLEEMVAYPGLDAVLIATPTNDHPAMVKTALAAGHHVLVEKPLAMSAGQARELAEVAGDGQVMCVMLNQRYHPVYAAIKKLLDSNAIGDLMRYSWTMTAWYRPDIYYQVSEWRGTWRGEGGGLLINQCIHNIDVLQWWLGLPDTVYAMAGFGKYHNIEVEDEVTALFTHSSGVTGTLIASSGEAPGINRLDLVGDKGVISFDGETLSLLESAESTSQHLRNTDEMFGMPEFRPGEISLDEVDSQHAAVLRDFLKAVETGEPPDTGAMEGLGSVTLANAILLSAWTGSAVTLPLDETLYEEELSSRVASSGLREPIQADVKIDMDKSYR